ncbi:T9SS type B sorting domain-containing protein [Aureibacter tunicatorum]|uniref:Gliding motility-associated-like protein n=1 Tax=Aureibacter tunicatorum TaxID=866807 RepID=A0AAE4BS58_9BACT|nr:gliding motility-associated C-terminal domain-containing protein [Aureibacter tunicatorum]MDR6240879.1 gliding motility-associated-like protein [Aureibacter tunicatorum]BDD03659.1 hypothetical protein AUTU_11420 [Aureibacter tunicatorum]
MIRKTLLLISFIFTLVDFNLNSANAQGTLPASEFDGFTCSGALFQIYKISGSSNYALEELKMNAQTQSVTLERRFLFNGVNNGINLNFSTMNAAAFNVKDGYIYFLANYGNSSNTSIYRLKKDNINGENFDYKVELVCKVGEYFNSGDIDVNGRYWCTGGGRVVYFDLHNAIYNPDGSQKTLPISDQSFTQKYATISSGIADIVFNPDDNKIYGWKQARNAIDNTIFDGRLVRINTTENDENLALETVSPQFYNYGGAGAVYFVDGQFWAYARDHTYSEAGQTTLIIFDPNDGTLQNGNNLSRGEPTGQNDGCSCAYDLTLKQTPSKSEFCLGDNVPEEELEFYYFFEITNRTRRDITEIPFELSLPEGMTFESNIEAFDEITNNYTTANSYFKLNNINGSSNATATNCTIELPYENSSKSYKFRVKVQISNSFQLKSEDGTNYDEGTLRIGLDNGTVNDNPTATHNAVQIKLSNLSDFKGYDDEEASAFDLTFIKKPNFTESLLPLQVNCNEKSVEVELPITLLEEATNPTELIQLDHKVEITQITDESGTNSLNDKVNITYNKPTDFSEGIYPVTISISNDSDFGTYIITWKESNGMCEDLINKEITFRKNSKLSASVAESEVCGSTATLTGSEAIAPNSYAWEITSDNADDASFDDINASSASLTINEGMFGEYTVIRKVINTEGCEIDSDPIKITFNEPITANIDNPITNACANDNPFIITGSNNTGTGVWTIEKDNNTVSIGSISDNILEIDPASITDFGTYDITWTVAPDNSSNCSEQSATTQITINNTIKLDAGNDLEVCGLSATLTGSEAIAPNSYAWEITGDNADDASFDDINTSSASLTINEGMFGEYTVIRKVINTESCEIDSDPITITFNEPIIASIDNPITNACANDNPFIITGSSNTGTGVWTIEKDNNTVSIGSISDNTLEIDPASITDFGTYDITWTVTPDNSSNCSEQSATTQITINNAIKLDAGNDLKVCSSSATLTGSEAIAPNSYAWEITSDNADDASFDNINASSASLTINEGMFGEYTVIRKVINTEGCEIDSDPITITFNEPIIASIDNPITNACANDNPFVITGSNNTGTGAWIIEKDNNTVSIGSISGNTLEINPASITDFGIYDITWTVNTNENNCSSASATTTISIGSMPEINGINVTLNNIDLGFYQSPIEATLGQKIKLNVIESSRQTDPIEYSWFQSSLNTLPINSTSELTEIVKGETKYLVFIQNQFGCSITREVNILSNNPPYAINDSVSVHNEKTIEIDILNNDSDADHRTLNPGNIDIDLDPETPEFQGSITTDGGTFKLQSNGKILFTPISDIHHGITKINYTITDKEGAVSNIAQITVYIYGRPVAINDTVRVQSNHEIAIEALYPIERDQDYDLDNDIIESTFKIIKEPEYGEIINIDLENGIVHYQAPDFSSIQNAEYDPIERSKMISFTYEICDSEGLCDQADIIVYIIDDRIQANELITPYLKDRKNDTFIINGLEFYQDNSLKIFNRWGQLVYEKENYDQSWDGTANTSTFGGKRLSQGTYFYILEVDKGKYKFNGMVQIAD